MLGKVLALSTLMAFVLLSALLQSTSPATIHPVGILSVFILLYVLALGVLTFIIFGLGKVLAGATKKGSRTDAITLRRAYFLASVLSLTPIIFLGMRSIGRSGMYDIVLVLLFEMIAIFYITKRW